MKNCVENDVRLKIPKTALLADYENSRRAAIHLFCVSCLGGSAVEASRCESYTCPLWPFRPKGKNSKRPDGYIPTKQQYEDKLK